MPICPSKHLHSNTSVAIKPIIYTIPSIKYQGAMCAIAFNGDHVQMEVCTVDSRSIVCALCGMA